MAIDRGQVPSTEFTIRPRREASSGAYYTCVSGQLLGEHCGI